MTITFTNSLGNSATFAYESASPSIHKYILDKFEPSSSVNAIKHTGYNQNGSTYVKSLVSSRTIKLSFWVYGEANYEQLGYIASIFSPTLGLGTLTVTTTRTRYIDCYVSQNVSESGSQDKLKHYTVTLEAPTPFFYGSSQSTLFSNENYDGPTFPLTFNPYVMMDYNGLLQTVVNDGDTPCPVKISITNTTTTNPKLTCVGTGELVGIIGTLKNTDKLVIDTSYGNKSITLNGKNSINLMNPYMNWVELPVGRSIWKFSADDTNPILTMSWNPLYNSF